MSRNSSGRSTPQMQRRPHTAELLEGEAHHGIPRGHYSRHPNYRGNPQVFYSAEDPSQPRRSIKAQREFHSAGNLLDRLPVEKQSHEGDPTIEKFVNDHLPQARMSVDRSDISADTTNPMSSSSLHKSADSIESEVL